MDHVKTGISKHYFNRPFYNVFCVQTHTETYLLVENTVKDKDEKALQRIKDRKDVVKCNLVRSHG